MTVALMENFKSSFLIDTTIELRKMAKNKSLRKLAHIIKIGGSTFDTGRYDCCHEILPNLAEIIIRLHQEGYPLVITCGAGPNADGLKSDRAAYGLSSETFSSCAADAVKNNCLMFADILKRVAMSRGRSVDAVQYHETTTTVITDGMFAEQISVVPFASDFVMGFYFDTRFDRSESDLHTLLIAEGIGHHLVKHAYAPGIRITFVKNTDAIYLFDPNRQDIDQSHNRKFEVLTIEDFLTNISRKSYDPAPEGEKLTDDHLLEENAAKLFMDRCSITSQIRVVKHTPPQNLETAVKYGKGGSLIINRHNRRHPIYRS